MMTRKKNLFQELLLEWHAGQQTGVKFMSLTSPIRMLRVSHNILPSFIYIHTHPQCAPPFDFKAGVHSTSMKRNKFLLCYEIYKQVVCSLQSTSASFFLPFCNRWHGYIHAHTLENDPTMGFGK